MSVHSSQGYGGHFGHAPSALGHPIGANQASQISINAAGAELFNKQGFNRSLAEFNL